MEELKTSDFYYDLPPELIAQDPLEDRSSSRLMVLDKETGEVSHHVFREIGNYLEPDVYKRQALNQITDRNKLHFGDQIPLALDSGHKGTGPCRRIFNKRAGKRNP